MKQAPDEWNIISTDNESTATHGAVIALSCYPWQLPRAPITLVPSLAIVSSYVCHCKVSYCFGGDTYTPYVYVKCAHPGIKCTAKWGCSYNYKLDCTLFC